jgi:hypothetical protein
MILFSALPHRVAGMEAASEVQNGYAEKATMHQMTRHDASCYLHKTSLFTTAIIYLLVIPKMSITWSS